MDEALTSVHPKATSHWTIWKVQWLAQSPQEFFESWERVRCFVAVGLAKSYGRIGSLTVAILDFAYRELYPADPGVRGYNFPADIKLLPLPLIQIPIGHSGGRLAQRREFSRCLPRRALH